MFNVYATADTDNAATGDVRVKLLPCGSFDCYEKALEAAVRISNDQSEYALIMSEDKPVWDCIDGRLDENGEPALVN
jgi:hypothetical protein